MIISSLAGTRRPAWSGSSLPGWEEGAPACEGHLTCYPVTGGLADERDNRYNLLVTSSLRGNRTGGGGYRDLERVKSKWAKILERK